MLLILTSCGLDKLNHLSSCEDPLCFASRWRRLKYRAQTGPCFLTLRHSGSEKKKLCSKGIGAFEKEMGIGLF